MEKSGGFLRSQEKLKSGVLKFTLINGLYYFYSSTINITGASNILSVYFFPNTKIQIIQLKIRLVIWFCVYILGGTE